MTEIEKALVCYDGDGSMPHCDLVWKALKTLQKADSTKWIPVTQRLPVVDDDNIDVLIYADGDISIGWYGWERHELMGIERYGADDFDGVPPHWHNSGSMHIFGSPVTHWMPLPEPPKEI